MINVNKKEYGQVFESKDKGWKLKHDYKNLKDLDYQPDQPQKPDQELSLWIESEDRFNELKNHILSVKDNALKTSTSDNHYNFNGMKKLIKDITNNKITIDDVINKVKKISSHVNKIESLRQRIRILQLILTMS